MMQKPIIISLAFLGSFGAALALASERDCFVPMAKWQPREAVQKMAEAQGWTVRRIKTDDGCYEVKGHDQAGRPIDVKIDPESLAIVDMDYDDEDESDRNGRSERRNAAPNGNAVPPNNGLFKNGVPPKVEVQ